MKLNLGCGKQMMEGWINVDMHFNDEVQPDVTCDLRIFPWSFESGEYSHIRCDNLVEHIDKCYFVDFIRECWRVLAVGGQLWIRVPDVINWPVGAFKDPTHVNYFCKQTFDYMNRNHHTWKNYGKSYGFPGFDVTVISCEEENGSVFLEATLEKR